MLQPCQDQYHKTFDSYVDMLVYHQTQESDSTWKRVPVNALCVSSLDEDSPLYDDTSGFAPGITKDAINDTAENLGLAIQMEGLYYPVRSTAYKSLLDRAKIGGSVLPKLKREDLAHILNACLKLHKSEALLLSREQKISAVHSGDETDYSTLSIEKLIAAVQCELNERFPKNVFDKGYSDHEITSACWSMPEQKDDLLAAYKKTLSDQGKSAIADKLTPGIRFSTSDTGIASAKVSALILGLQTPIHIGGVLSVDHRHKKTVEDFKDALTLLFAQYGDTIKKLEDLNNIYLNYPVNAMTAVSKKLSLPKKAALNAIGMFEMACGSENATAHDVFMALQEIMFILKTEGIAESKRLVIEENLSRALTIRWSDYDTVKAVSY